MIIGRSATLEPPPIDELIGVSPVAGADQPPGRLEHQAQAFVAQLPPDRELYAHFHPVDQFQVFIRGSGEIAHEPLRAEIVHYADAHHPYGPIHSGPSGLGFLTLRTWGDRGSWRMPESRETLASSRAEHPDRPSRNLAFDLSGVRNAENWEWLADEEGLRVGVFQTHGPAPVPLPTMAGDGGFLVVLSGTVRVAGEHVAATDVVFLRPGEQPESETEEAGAKLAFLQFPPPAHGSS